MKCLILLSLVMFVMTDDVKCPADIDTSVSCTKEYKPVCGFSSDGNVRIAFILVIRNFRKFMFCMQRRKCCLLSTRPLCHGCSLHCEQSRWNNYIFYCYLQL